METKNINNNEKKTNNKNVVAGVATGAAATVGAAAGVVGGTLAYEHVKAGEVDVEVIDDNGAMEAATNGGAEGAAAHEPAPRATVPPVQEPVEPGEPVEPAEPGGEEPGGEEPGGEEPGGEEPGGEEPGGVDPVEPVEPGEPVVEVLEFETDIETSEGNIDAAILSVDGETVMVVDMDQDGIADALVADFNGDGYIDDSEIVDISGDNVAMEPFADDYYGIEPLEDPSIAYEPDYVNDANVDEFMA